jgi:hypothetical protein
VWAGLSFAPTLAATLDKGLLGERYLYLPLAGLALAISAGMPRVTAWAPVAFAVPAIAFLQLRLPDWQNSTLVWQKAHEHAPSPFTHGGLAWYLNRQGDVDEGIDHMLAALEGDPPYRDVCDMVISLLLSQNRVEEAAKHAKWAIDERGCPPEGQITNHYAVALAGTGQWDEALRIAQRRPGGPSGPGLVVIAAAWARVGRMDAVAQLAPRHFEPARFAAHVAKLLRLSGEAQAAARVLALTQTTAAPQATPPETSADAPAETNTEEAAETSIEEASERSDAGQTVESPTEP